VVTINAETKLYGVIGHPLGHTLSPTIHNAAFKAAGLNAVYLQFETMSLEQALNGLMAIGCKGLSITLPFKEEIIKYLDRVDPLAGIIGAVNTLVNQGGCWVGYNTDASAAIRAIEEVEPVWRKSCVLIGAGGVARAIGFALRERGCPLIVVNRSRQRGEKLARDLHAVYIPMEEVDQIETEILVQATAVGMYPHSGQVPMDPAKIKARVVMDVIYNPAQTQFLKQSGLQGAATIPGTRMFLYQGAEQFRLWTGLRPPLEVMEKAFLQALPHPCATQVQS